MPREIELIGFLAKIVHEHTKAYQSDFDYDIATLRSAMQETQAENRTFYWMSRPHGTWCVRERDVFLRESEAHAIWTHYENNAEGIIAYRVIVTGDSRGDPMGRVWNYSREECELDAQSVSYILCRRFGVPCELPDVSRVAGLYDGWEPEERRSALDCIHDMSKQIGGSIDKSMEPKAHSRAPMKRPAR